MDDMLPMMSATQLANAPFNEPEGVEEDFEVNVTETLVKKETLHVPIYTFDEGCPVTDDVEWNEEFLRNHTPVSSLLMAMADELEILVEQEEKAVAPYTKNGVYRREPGEDCAWESHKHLMRLKYLIDEAEGWSTDELEVEY